MADLLYEADELYDAVLLDFDGHRQIPGGDKNPGGLVSGSDSHLTNAWQQFAPHVRT